MAARIPAHVIAERSENYISSAVVDYYTNGDAFFRKVSGRDYGVDGIIELFDAGNPTGIIAYVQIKGTSSIIEKLKRSEEVSCSGISGSNLKYAFQNRIPMILLYVSVSSTRDIYYLELQDALEKKPELRNIQTKDVSIRIPIQNRITNNMEPLFELIRSYY